MTYCCEFHLLSDVSFARGLKVTTTHADVPDGLACGVSRQGALLVRSADGVTAQVASGEVSVRLADA